MKVIKDLEAGIIFKCNFEGLNGDLNGKGIFMLKIKGMHHLMQCCLSKTAYNT